MLQVYAQITTRCNMTCPHCLFSCRKTGVDMSMGLFKYLCEILSELPETPSMVLGGGEPTLHADLFEMISIAHKAGIPLSTIVNGVDTEKTLTLFRDKRITTYLSWDVFHDRGRVAGRVYRAAAARNALWRKSTDTFFKVGRGAKLAAHKPEGALDLEQFSEEDINLVLRVDPNGVVYRERCGVGHAIGMLGKVNFKSWLA